MEERITSLSTTDTEAAGEALCRELLGGGKRRVCITLRGEMGVGKTAFVRGFARALGINSVKSPTYTVVNEYRGDPLPIFHFDLYRIADEDELYAIGFDDYLGRDGFILCEWSENGGDMLPADRITVEISRVVGNENERIITRSEA